MNTTTITSKGQVLIPKHMRDALGVAPRTTVVLEYDAKHNRVILTSGKDIVDRAGSVQPKKVRSALALRKEYEKKYNRI